MKAILLICFAVFLLASGVRVTAADSIPKVLSKTEVQFLDSLKTVKIGTSEDELLQIFPDLGALRKPDSRSKQELMVADFPHFTLVGLEWKGCAEFVDGKLSRIWLGASAWYSEYAGLSHKLPFPRQSLPRHEVRKAGLLISSHYQRRIGEVTERYVPDMDCPSGNPFGLRHTWRTKAKALRVEFYKNASQSSVMIELADWAESQRVQKELYESAWPLKPAPRALLREAARPR